MFVPACIAVSAAACTTEIAGSAAPAGPSTGEQQQPAGLDDYEFPDDGSDFSRDEFDQPMPVPGYNWEGWADQEAGRCAWVPDGLFDGLASGQPVAAGHFCSFLTPDDNNVQITWGVAYGGPYLYDPVAFLEPAEVAGLQARTFDLAANQNVYPGSCQVGVNTRSMSSFTVLHWNEHSEPLDKEASCATAHQAAEVIAEAMVPLAGGTVWPSTVQEPDPSIVDDDACQIVDDVTTTFAGIEVGDDGHQPGSNELGSTCVAERDPRESAALLTDGPEQGLADVPPPDGAEVSDTRIGPLAARTEILGRTCAVGVELVPGRLLRVQYSTKEDPTLSCQFAQLMTLVAVQRLIERSP